MRIYSPLFRLIDTDHNPEVSHPHLDTHDALTPAVDVVPTGQDEVVTRSLRPATLPECCDNRGG